MRTHLESPIYHRTRCGLPLATLPSLRRYALVGERPTCKSCQRALEAHARVKARVGAKPVEGEAGC